MGARLQEFKDSDKPSHVLAALREAWDNRFDWNAANLAQQYLDGRLHLKVYWRARGLGNYCTVFESSLWQEHRSTCPHRAIFNVELCTAGGHDDHSVLVYPVKLVNCPERMPKPLSSVRLFRRYRLSHQGGCNALYLRLEGGTSSLPVSEYGELGTGSDAVGRRRLMDKVIQRRSEMVDYLACLDCESDQQRIDRTIVTSAHQIQAGAFVTLKNKSIGVAFDKATDFGVEITDTFVGPIDLRIAVTEGRLP